MKLAIVTPTYQRKDGKTPYYLNRAIESIKKQTHKEFKYFLIGDKYEDDAEFNSFRETLSDVDLHIENLPIAKEREKYSPEDRNLWYCGGVNAYNHGIKLALEQGYEWVCHLDHDDYWDPDHLESISRVIDTVENLALVYTCSEYVNNEHRPEVQLDGQLSYQCPAPYQTIHSSVCINHRLIPLLYRDVYEETNGRHASEADIDMWNRTSQYLSENIHLKSVLIKKISCHHVEERI